MKRFFLFYSMIYICFVTLFAAEVQIKNLSDKQGEFKKDSLYLVIDISEGTKAMSYPVSYISAVPKGGWTIDYKTNKIVLRRIKAGTFTMGSPSDEIGRIDAREDLHKVTLTKPYYMGVF